MAPDPDGLRRVAATIAARIHASVPALTDVSHHPGTMTLEEATRAAVKAPRAWLALTGIESVSRGRGVDAPAYTLRLGLGLSLLCRDGVAGGALRLARQDQAANLAAALTLTIATAGWGDPALGRAEELRARNIHDEAQGAGGVLIRSFSWRQDWTVGCAGLDGTTPLEVWLGRAPEIGPDHIEDYERLGRAPGVVPPERPPGDRR